MQAKKTLILGLLALAAVPLSAQNRVICHDWNAMNDAYQIGYISGFRDGMEIAGQVAAFGAAWKVSLPHPDFDKVNATADAEFKAVGAMYFGPNTFGEAQKGITAICKLPENSSIQISSALQAFTMQVQGKPQSEIDEFLASARRIAIILQDSDKPNK